MYNLTIDTSIRSLEKWDFCIIKKINLKPLVTKNRHLGFKKKLHLKLLF